MCEGYTGLGFDIPEMHLHNYLHLYMSPASDLLQDAKFAICLTYMNSAVCPKVLAYITHLTSARCGTHLIPRLSAIESPSACSAAADAVSWCPQQCCLHTVLTA